MVTDEPMKYMEQFLQKKEANGKVRRDIEVL